MSAPANVLMQSWYPHLHEFNLLPSRLLHPSWASHFSLHGAIDALRIAFDDDAALHRHWSACILDRLGLAQRPWLDDEAPQLPLTILPADVFDQLLLLTGTVLAGAAVRRAIRRDDVAALEAALGPQALAFARMRGSEFHAGLDIPATDTTDLLRQVGLLGGAALLHALQGSPDELFERVRLRLPIDTPVAASAPLSDLAPAEVLELMLCLTSEVAPEWLSFCATAS